MSETDEAREPDVADDPRQQGTAQGYPESNPAGQTPVEGTERGPEAGTEAGNEATHRASESHAGQDGKPSQATGNPAAAGG